MKWVIYIVSTLLIVGAFGFVVFALGYKNDLPKKETGQAVVVATTLPTPTNLNKDMLFAVVNNWRVATGRKAYIENKKLCNFAKIRIDEIITDWSHKQFSPLVKKMFPNGEFIGENLAHGRWDEQGTLTAWLDSPTHRNNLEYNFKYSCIETNGAYAVQIFGNL